MARRLRTGALAVLAAVQLAASACAWPGGGPETPGSHPAARNPANDRIGALFLGINKRRAELELLRDDAGSHRKILDEYSTDLLDQMAATVTAAVLMAYGLYTFTAEGLPENHSMMLTIPFVLYGIFRYLYLVHNSQVGGSPEEILLRDIPTILTIIGWVIPAAVVLLVARE